MNNQDTTIDRSLPYKSPDPQALALVIKAHEDEIVPLEITSDLMYGVAGEALSSVKATAKQLEEREKSLTKPLLDVVADIRNLFRPARTRASELESSIKARMVAYQEDVERKAAEARAKAEEQSRRALAEVAAREAAAREALEGAQTPEAEDEAHEALAEAQAAAISVVVPPTAAPAVPKVSGVSTRTTWGYEVTDKMALVKHVAERTELLHLLEVNGTALGQLVRALKENTNLPGVKAVANKSIASR